MVGNMSIKSEAQAEAVKALRQARKLARRENNVEALLAAASVGFQFSLAQSSPHEPVQLSQPSVGFGVDHD